MNFLGGGGAGDIQHHQQFHQVVIDGGRQRLDDENDARTDTGAELDIQVVIAEPADQRLLERQVQVGGNIGSQVRVRTAAENADFVRVKGCSYWSKLNFLSNWRMGQQPVFALPNSRDKPVAYMPGIINIAIQLFLEGAIFQRSANEQVDHQHPHWDACPPGAEGDGDGNV